MRPVVPRRPRQMEDLDRVESPRPGRHHPDERDVLLGVSDRPQALLEIADLRRREQRQAAGDGVRDPFVAKPGDDRLAVLVLAVEHGEALAGRPTPSPGLSSDLIESTMAAASSSGLAHVISSTFAPGPRIATSCLSGRKRV